jgi:23S rRNA (uridine2552-2'-O)-methyltransferase
VPRVPYDRHDAHFRRARAAGYRARSAFKLIELDDRFRILRTGERVADLGAWPGAWLQVAAERVGPEGRVVGIDLTAVTPLGAPNVVAFEGDVRDPNAIGALRKRLGGPAGVVLSDLSPKLTGVRDTDEARVTELAGAGLDAAAKLLRPGGRLLMKLFMNSDFPALIDRTRQSFAQVKTTKPQATRRGSSEVYIVGLDFRLPPSCG